MRGHADLAALVAMRRVVAVIDQQHRIVVRELARAAQADRGRPVGIGGEIVAASSAVERGEADRGLVEMVLEQAVDAVRPQPGEAAGNARAGAASRDAHIALGTEPIRQGEAQALAVGVERRDIERAGHQGRAEAGGVVNVLRPHGGRRRFILHEGMRIQWARNVHLVREEHGMQHKWQVLRGRGCHGAAQAPGCDQGGGHAGGSEAEQATAGE